MGTPSLKDYDVVVVNSSGGKDSQAMLDYVVEKARSESYPLGNVVVVHADLGRVEWAGTAELAERQAAAYGLRFIKVARPQGDLLEEIEKRGMFPSSTTRYCTAHHKRGQIHKVFTALVKERKEELWHWPKYRVRILNCMGMRAAESPARAKKETLKVDERASNGKREVTDWLPIHEWSLAEVWRRIKASGVEYHPIYDAGMPRVSCCFCVLASKSALVRAAQLNPELAAEYADVEERIGHTFQNGRSMAQIIEEAEKTGDSEPVEVADWNA